METRTFNQIISRVIEQGASKVEIHRSKSHAGCVAPGDIIAVYFYRDNNTNSTYYCCYRAALCHIFDNPTIVVDRIWRERETNRAMSTDDTIKEFIYAK